MSMTDPVADLLTRIRNASKAQKNALDVPASNIKREVVRILMENHYLRDVVELPDKKQGILRIYLRYGTSDVPVLKGIQRLSKPGLRRYIGADEVKRSTHHVRGMMVVSTSQGVMTNFDAAKRGIGGEALLKCW